MLVTLNRRDWVQAIKLKEQQDYFNTDASLVPAKLVTDRQISPMHFQDPANLQKFIQN